MDNGNKYLYRNDLWKGEKEITLKEGDDAFIYINSGYKVCIPQGLIVNGNTGKVMVYIER